MTGKNYMDIMDIINNETECKGMKWEEMQQAKTHILLELAEGLGITTQLTMAVMRKYLGRQEDWNQFKKQFESIDEREGCNNYLELREKEIMEKTGTGNSSSLF